MQVSDFMPSNTENKMDCDATNVNEDVFAPRQPAVTLTFDLQNLTRSSVGASEHSLQLS